MDLETEEHMSTKGSIKRAPREPEIRAADRATLVEMMRRGYTHQAIADKLGITNAMVSIEWRCVLRDRRKRMDEDTELLVAHKLEEYEELKREAWEAWKKSQEPAEEEYIENTEGDRGNKTTEGKRRKGQSGNPAYLKVVVECLEAERELQALNPAKEIKGTLFMANWGEILSSMPKDGTIPDEVASMIEQALNGEAPKQIQSVEVKDAVS